MGKLPYEVANLEQVIGISGGLYHTCALLPGNKGACWGLNSTGQLGTGDTKGHNKPVHLTIVPNET